MRFAMKPKARFVGFFFVLALRAVGAGVMTSISAVAPAAGHRWLGNVGRGRRAKLGFLRGRGTQAMRTVACPGGFASKTTFAVAFVGGELMIVPKIVPVFVGCFCAASRNLIRRRWSALLAAWRKSKSRCVARRWRRRLQSLRIKCSRPHLLHRPCRGRRCRPMPQVWRRLLPA